MIYSNRILEKGLVKLPMLSGNFAWEIKHTTLGDAWLTVVGFDGHVTDYMRPLPMPSTFDDVYQRRVVENMACSIKYEMLERDIMSVSPVEDDVRLASVTKLFG